MTNNITAIQEELNTMSDGQLWVHLCFAREGESKWPELSAVECLGLIVQERIHRHSETCDGDCNFSPIASEYTC